MKKILIIILNIIIIQNSISQIIEKPNFAERTHPTLVIDKIEITDKQTIVYLTVTNEIANGWFCADKNISIKNSFGSETYKIIKSENIPVCPNQHKFNLIGETLSFKLYFSTLSKSIKYIDITENCNDACFHFNGVVLDATLNSEIDLGYERFAKGKSDLAAICFKNVIEKFTDYNYASPYFSLMQIYAEKENYSEAKNWFTKLQNSKTVDKQTIIDLVKQQTWYDKIK